jgi:hypothetical protein
LGHVALADHHVPLTTLISNGYATRHNICQYNWLAGHCSTIAKSTTSATLGNCEGPKPPHPLSLEKQSGGSDCSLPPDWELLPASDHGH